MLVSELIQKLQDLMAEHGDVEVGYVDNGDFAENGGWVEPDPIVGAKGCNGQMIEYIAL